MAALTAALMSTVDTLVTAVSVIVVNDIYKPRNPKATEKQLLKMAVVFFCTGRVHHRGCSCPIFADFKSIYAAHGAFTAITPPLVVALLFGVLKKVFINRRPLDHGGWFDCDFLFNSVPQHDHPICTWCASQRG